MLFQINRKEEETIENYKSRILKDIAVSRQNEYLLKSNFYIEFLSTFRNFHSITYLTLVFIYFFYYYTLDVKDKITPRFMNFLLFSIFINFILDIYYITINRYLEYRLYKLL